MIHSRIPIYNAAAGGYHRPCAVEFYNCGSLEVAEPFDSFFLYNLRQPPALAGLDEYIRIDELISELFGQQYAKGALACARHAYHDKIVVVPAMPRQLSRLIKW